MTALALIITDAGRQAIVDETNAVTLPVTITEIAYGDGTWVPDEAATGLDNEVKRISQLGSNSAAAPDTISLTATDSSADTYTVREIGLYTDTGVLFAVYAQADPILTKAVDAASLATFDLIFDTVPAGSVTVGDASFDYPPATTDGLGVVELSTQPEMDTGTSSTLIPPVSVVAAYVAARLAALVDASPATLDTLNELAEALGDDPNFAATMVSALAGKAASSHNHNASDVNAGTLGSSRLPAPTTTARGGHKKATTASNRFIDNESGFVMQWGIVTVSANTVSSVTLPVAYTVAHDMAMASYNTTSTGEVDPPGATKYSLTKIKVSNSMSGSRSIAWLSAGRISV